MKIVRIEASSFFLGVIATCLVFVTVRDENRAEAIDLNNLANMGATVSSSVKSLASLKKNLDADVTALTGNAKILLSDKDNLKLIKEQLLKLATETRAQIDSVSQLVATVDDHLRQTKQNIETTSKHVGEIDGIKKSLTGK